MSTLREAAQQALEFAADIVRGKYKGNAEEMRDALRAALAQQEQEPVAWIQPDHLQKARVAPFLCRVEPTKRMADFVAIYTAPPRREWQSLTDDEISALFPSSLRSDYKPYSFARAVEQACKERNT
jgi:hypothetical protein